MTTINRKKIVADQIHPSFTNKTVEVTWTATMANGSLLAADGTEVAKAGIANAAMVINDYTLDTATAPEVGDVLIVNAVKFGAKVYLSQVRTSDDEALVEADVAGATALAAAQIEFV